jgi:hypothetical protein
VRRLVIAFATVVQQVLTEAGNQFFDALEPQGHQLMDLIALRHPPPCHRTVDEFVTLQNGDRFRSFGQRSSRQGADDTSTDNDSMLERQSGPPRGCDSASAAVTDRCTLSLYSSRA